MACQAASDAAAVIGGEVYFPPGTYRVTDLVWYSKVWFRGAGMGSTILKRYGAGDVIKSDDFDALTGTSSTGGVNSCRISDLSINGDFDNDAVPATTLSGNVLVGDTTINAVTTGFAASGSIVIVGALNSGLSEVVTYTGVTGTSFTGCTRAREDTIAVAHTSGDVVFQRSTHGYGIRVYGYDFKIDRVAISRTRQDGLYAEWAPVGGSLPSPHSMDASVSNVKIHHCQGTGLTWLGPHDSKLHTMLSWVNNLHGIRVVGNAAAENWTNCHSYGVQVFSWVLGSGGQLENCIGEQAKNGQFLIIGNETLLSNCWAFGSAGTAVKGFLLGDGTRTVTATRIGGYVRSCEAGAVDFTGDGGGNVVDVSNYQLTGNAFVGTAAATTRVMVRDQGAGATLNGNTFQIPSTSTARVLVGAASSGTLEIFSALDCAGTNAYSAINYALYLHKTSFATGAAVGLAFADANSPAVQASIISTRQGAGLGSLEFITASTAGFPAERMRIDKDGHVGIGVTSPAAMLHLPAGTATAGTGPLLLTSGTVLSSPVAGMLEFTTDDFFATITTGTARKAFVLDNGTRLTSGRVPFATTNGRLTDSASLVFDGTHLGIGVATPTNDLSFGNSAAHTIWTENSATDVVGRATTIAAGSTVAGTSVNDVVGGNLILQAGLGTGAAVESIHFQLGTNIASGKVLQTMSTKVSITNNGILHVIPLAGAGSAIAISTGYNANQTYRNDIVTSVHTSTATSNYLTFAISDQTGTNADTFRINGGGIICVLSGKTLAVGNTGTVVRSGTAGTNKIDLFDGTAPTGTLTNGVSLYSGSGKLKSIDAAGTDGHVVIASAVNVQTPTLQNRTITVDIGGTTYYITAKTTND